MGKRLILILSLGAFAFLVLIGWVLLSFFLTSARPCGGSHNPPCSKSPISESVVNCLKRKVESGDKRSAFVLSYYLALHGYYDEHISWRQIAADMGYSPARAGIAEFSRFEASGEEEKKIIAELIKLGEEGDYTAARALSDYYGRGFLGFRRDREKASFWQKRAAELLQKKSEEEKLQRKTLSDCEKEMPPSGGG